MKPRDRNTSKKLKKEISRDDTQKKLKELDQKLGAQKKIIQKFMKSIESEKEVKESDHNKSK